MSQSEGSNKTGWIALLSGAGCLGISALGAIVLFIPLVVIILVAALAGGGGDSANAAEGDCKAPAVTSEDTDGQTVNVPSEYQEAVKAAAEEAGLPEAIVAAQINQESKWDPTAGSPAGAQGIAQFMPATWETYGEGKDIHDPIAGIEALGRYMKDLKGQVNQYAEDDPDLLVQLTLAAYNAGPGAVASANGVPPYPETEDYIEKITGTSQMTFSEGCKATEGNDSWDGDLGDGEWTNPLPEGQFTSGYGPRNIPGLPAWAQQHVGVDLATASGAPGAKVIAPTDMVVVGFIEADGCTVTRATGDPEFGFSFCHMNSSSVAKGDQLKRGDVVGIEGNKAGSVGGGVAKHLHLEMYKPDCGAEMNYPYDGCNINPEPILKEKGAWVE